MAELRAEAGRPGTVEITLGAGDASADDLRRLADLGVARALVTAVAEHEGGARRARRGSPTRSCPPSPTTRRRAPGSGVAGGRPEFGVYLPQVALDGPAVLERARVAEETGLDSLWFYDHLYSPGQPDRPSLEAWTLASWVLARTERLGVGHLVLCNNFRHPALLAKMAATLDVLSGGRVELGLGSGSVEGEHLEAGLPWGTAAERAERLDEALCVLDRHVRGGAGHLLGPPLPAGRPAQRPHPRAGGRGSTWAAVGPRHTLPLVARHADVWSVPTYGLADWEGSRRRLDAECAAIGRDPSTVRTSHEAVLVLAPDEPSLAVALAQARRRYGGPGWGLEAGGYIGTPGQVAARIAEAAERGVSLFVFFTHDRADPRTLELFAERVVPELG